MKKLEIVIKPDLLDDAKVLLESCDIKGMMVSNIMGYGNQKGFTKTYRGTTYTVNFLPKIMIETTDPRCDCGSHYSAADRQASVG